MTFKNHSSIYAVLIFFAIVTLFSDSVRGQSNPDELNLGQMIRPLNSNNIFRDPEYYNWGSSIIKGKDGKYHLFYARWPRKYSFYAWLPLSEIAHAVSGRPEGPYVYKETVLKGRGGDHWDAITAHNPKIKYFDGKYYLYYISTRSDTVRLNQKELTDIAKTGYNHKYWWLLRNNQRTGVAIAGSLDGPWKRLDAPIVEPDGPITTLTVNPAITKGPDGRYYMIVKGDKPNETRFIRNQAIATSLSPAGPFKIYPKPVIGNLDTEDVSMWFSQREKRFYAIFHAHTFIGMMTSANGLDWEKARHYVVTEKRLEMADGSVLKPDRMERPFLYQENDVPRVLSLAIKIGDDSYAVFVPLKDSTH